MNAVVSRPQPLGSSTGSHHAPRKSASHMSLRREKDKHADAYGANGDPSRPSYFEAYPRPKTASARSTPFKSKSRETFTPATHTPPSPDDLSFSDHTLREKKREPRGPMCEFPTIEPVAQTIQIPPKSRARSRTGPSKKPSWTDPSSFRISGSSTQNTESPPETPVDNISFRDYSVLVAAPASGVETMDALVDGMNGGDDILSNAFSRSRFGGIPGHHPLYQPPLPTPPPGIVLGGGKLRRPKKTSKPPPTSRSSYSSDDEDDSPPNPPHKRRPRRQGPTRSSSNATLTLSVSGPSDSPPMPSSPPSFPYSSLSRRSSRDSFGSSLNERPRSVAPSISDIIKAYAPSEAQARSRVSLHRTASYVRSHDHATVREESEPEPEPLSKEEEAEFLSRSSMDSVADEIQRTLRTQTAMKHVQPPPPSSYIRRHSAFSDNASIASPRSDGGSASLYSMSTSSQTPTSPYDSSQLLSSLPKPSPSHAVAQYLRSARLTTLLKLTRSPHASSDNPLTVSLSDLGNPSGIPVVVFLGLGCVRHIMGLYDEMAECLGLRLITIDRWGLGRTEPRAKSTKGIMQWAYVVEEVLDLLHIERCSVMAHSAGAPYALSFANKLPKRIRGDICLLAPWVGGNESNGGYRWLKYVPNGLLKTAQAAEWKLQAWMIGKPPTIAYEGIGFNMQAQPSSAVPSRSASPTTTYGSNQRPDYQPRPSIASSTFSEYDDLRDFDGRFESHSTLGAEVRTPRGNEKVAKRKNSRGLFDRFKTPSSPPTQPSPEKTPGRRLKSLRSMGSLKSKSSHSSPPSKFPPPSSPPTLNFEVGLAFDDNWTNSITRDDRFRPSERYPVTPRANGRRSLSFTSGNGATSLPSSPHDTTFSSNASLPATTHQGDGFQATLANALIAASHSESAKGTHNDLLQILNHENHPWGFSYTSYPHDVKVWYGDKDEKIAENAVRWMERTMGEEKCTVKVVRGADHGLMYKSSVVVEVLEHLADFWHDD